MWLQRVILYKHVRKRFFIDYPKFVVRFLTEKLKKKLWGNNSAMKVLYIVNQFPCLSETFVYNQIKGLKELGHDVKVLAVYKGVK